MHFVGFLSSTKVLPQPRPSHQRLKQSIIHHPLPLTSSSTSLSSLAGTSTGPSPSPAAATAPGRACGSSAPRRRGAAQRGGRKEIGDNPRPGESIAHQAGCMSCLPLQQGVLRSVLGKKWVHTTKQLLPATTNRNCQCKNIDGHPCSAVWKRAHNNSSLPLTVRVGLDAGWPPPALLTCWPCPAVCFAAPLSLRLLLLLLLLVILVLHRLCRYAQQTWQGVLRERLAQSGPLQLPRTLASKNQDSQVGPEHCSKAFSSSWKRSSAPLPGRLPLRAGRSSSDSISCSCPSSSSSAYTCRCVLLLRIFRRGTGDAIGRWGARGCDQGLLAK